MQDKNWADLGEKLRDLVRARWNFAGGNFQAKGILVSECEHIWIMEIVEMENIKKEIAKFHGFEKGETVMVVKSGDESGVTPIDHDNNGVFEIVESSDRQLKLFS